MKFFNNGKMTQVMVIFLAIHCCTISSFAQDALIPVSDTIRQSDSFRLAEYSIAYDIKTTSRKNNTIAETYNGGIKTVYVKNDKVKIVLASLMRIQSLFFSYSPKNPKPVVVVKESGAQKIRYDMNQKAWKDFNKKYDSALCLFSTDSLLIKNYLCKKAVIKIKGEKELIVWYFPTFQNRAILAAEPMFGCIPGIVLQYEYHKSSSESIMYTANDISFLPIAEKSMQVPFYDYTRKKYVPGQADKITKEDLPSDDEMTN